MRLKLNFWPFNRKGTILDLENRLAAITGSLAQIQAACRENERLRERAETKLRSANLELETLRPAVESLKGESFVARQAHQRKCTELLDLQNALSCYGYPIEVGALRGKLKVDEELFLASQRKERDDAEAEED